MEKPLKNAERTEEVQHIIEKMPSKFGTQITVFVLSLLIIFFSLGWIVKYPDVVSGLIVINSSQSPVKLVCNSAGKLQLLNVRNQRKVKEGEYLALIENGTNLTDFRKIKALCETLRIKEGKDVDKFYLFPKTVNLGDINVSYFQFIDVYEKLTNFYRKNLYNQKIQILNSQIVELKKTLEIAETKLEINKENMVIIRKSRYRDSVLFEKKVLAESETEKSKIALITAKDGVQSLLRDISNASSQLDVAKNSIHELNFQEIDIEKQLRLSLISRFTELQDNISKWEQKYVFKATMTGHVQYLNFWVNNQFIEAGQSVFAIIPLQTNVIGQMTLPAKGAGKVKKGQRVIIKLEDYPFMEYGSVSGIVSSIGLIPNSDLTREGSLETYLVNIILPKGLTTNYKKKLNFRFQIKGGGDIVTSDRRLIERIFDNLSYKFEE